MSNPINPSHYKDNGYGMEVIDMMVAVFGKEAVATYCTINAFKYRMRAGNKESNPAEQDLGKEQWYISKAQELAAKSSGKGATNQRGKLFWTPERVELLKTMSVSEAAKHFGMKESSIYTLRHKFGFARKYAKGKAAKQAKPAKVKTTKEYDNATYEEKQNAREDALRVSAEHGARATEGKVSVRVDPRTTVLMSPKKAEEFKRKQQASEAQ